MKNSKKNSSDQNQRDSNGAMMDKSGINSKKLKEEVVPHKLKIKKMFNNSTSNTNAAAGDHDDDPGSTNSRPDSSDIKDKKQRKKMLDAEISKGDIKMRAALNSYLSVSESDNEETK